jgi:hypothetical protein
MSQLRDVLLGRRGHESIVVYVSIIAMVAFVVFYDRPEMWIAVGLATGSCVWSWGYSTGSVHAHRQHERIALRVLMPQLMEAIRNAGDEMPQFMRDDMERDLARMRKRLKELGDG